MNRGNWQTAQSILCVRLDSLGDVLLTTPAVRALKQSGSGRRVTLLTSPSGAAAARLVPEIDEVIVYEAPWMKAGGERCGSSADRQTIGQLAARSFDAAVIFTVYSQNPLPAALFCFLADIPLRLAHCRENPYQLLTDWECEPEPEQLVRHEVRRQLDLVATIGAACSDDRLRIRIPCEAQRRVRRLSREIGLESSGSWVVMHPGSTAASRRYAPEQFAAVADHLCELGLQVVFTGDESEQGLIETIAMKMVSTPHSLCGRLDLAELAALIGIAPVLVSNNTGPVHVAAAVGTPVVDLYALTNPQHTPWRVPHRVLYHDVPCRYCYRSICPEGHHNCLRLVEPEEVVRAVLEMLDETRGGSSTRLVENEVGV